MFFIVFNIKEIMKILSEIITFDLVRRKRMAFNLVPEVILALQHFSNPAIQGN